MKYPIAILILFAFCPFLLAQKFNIQIEGGGTLAGTQQINIIQGTQKTNQAFCPNIGLKLGYSIPNTNLNVHIGGEYHDMALTYHYTTFVYTGDSKTFSKVFIKYGVLRVPLEFSYKIKLSEKWAFLPVIGGAFSYVVDDYNIFYGIESEMTGINNSGEEFLLEYQLGQHNLFSSNFSLDYGLMVERKISDKFDIYFKTINQYNFNSNVTYHIIDRLYRDHSYSPGTLATKTSNLMFNVGLNIEL